MIITKPYKNRLIACVVSVLLALCFHHFISQQIDFVTYSNKYLRIQDYAYYIIIVKAFWFDNFGDIYELVFQQHALSDHVGSMIYNAMPLGITPIALIIWLPFAYVARFNMALSYTLWITFSLSVLFTSMLSIGRNFFIRKNLPILPITLSLITVFSATTFFAIILGQTSILVAGILIHLICCTHKTTKEMESISCLPILLLIFFLGIKPTYLALGLGLLIIYGMWRQTIYSVMLVLFIILSFTPLLTKGWILSYYHQLSIFSRNSIPDVYAWAFVPYTMNIFRSAFHNIIGDNLASLISTIVTCSVYIGVVWLSIPAKIKGISADSSAPLRVTKDQLFVVIIGNYLLFSPYAGGYEDVLLLPVFVTVLCVGHTPPLTSYKSLALAFFLFVILFHNIFPVDKPLWLLWLLKALILGYMLYFCRCSSERKIMRKII